MRMTLFQIRDAVAEQMLGTIMPCPSNAAATRMFLDIIKAPNTAISEHPDDYELVMLGYQDSQTGAITPSAVPETILTGTQVLWGLEHNSRAAAAAAEAQPRPDGRNTPVAGADRTNPEA